MLRDPEIEAWCKAVNAHRAAAKLRDFDKQLAHALQVDKTISAFRVNRFMADQMVRKARVQMDKEQASDPTTTRKRP